MFNCENLLLNVVLLLLLFKFFQTIDSTLIKNKKNNPKYKSKKIEQFVENFEFNNEDMYKLKYTDLKNINELAKSTKKNLLTSLTSLNGQNNIKNLYKFPLYSVDRHNWSQLFLPKIKLNTYNNEEYYKKFSEN